MADSFSWKSLFINEESGSESTKKEESKTPETHKIPTKQFPAGKLEPKEYTSNITSSASSNLNQGVLESVLEMYEKGFDSLNQPGYDFYEFFKAIMAINPENDQAYTMAYTMATSMDSSLDKAKLIEKANFYITEINNVHQKYEGQGNGKKGEILNAQSGEKENLTRQVADLENQIKALQKELDTKSGQLGQVDSKYANKVIEIDQKLMANNIAKDTILSAINKVVRGIEKNIKS